MNFQTFKENIEYLTGETKQNKIADQLHVSVSKISKWFNGDLLPTFTDILNISKTYHCSIDWLIGNKYKDEWNLSEYDICRLLVELDRKCFLNIELREIDQKITFIDDNNKAMAEQEYNQTIPVIYFPNSASFEHIAFTEELYYNFGEVLNENEDEEDIEDSVFENEKDIVDSTSFGTNIAINDFLMKYLKLKEGFYQKIIPLTAFNDVINSYLTYMSRSTHICEEGINFNIPGATSPEEKFKIAIKRYEEEMNVKLKE